MPRNDRSDSLSVRGDDDPRRELKKMEQEAELELGASEARNTGGVEHQTREERERPEAEPARAPDAPEGNEHP
jgi:hypothetical protein